MVNNSNTSGRGGTISTTQTTTSESQPVLYLRSETKKDAKEKSKSKSKSKSRRNVSWKDDVIDNENMNKKKSKICCIFHPQREFGELSTDESSDSSSDSSDSDSNSGHNSKQNDDDDKCCNHDHKAKSKAKRPSSPNAYEKQPNFTNKSVLPPHTSI